jgi:hypothetical protein
MDARVQTLDAIPAMSEWVRGSLAGLGLGLIVVFGIAFWLDPYHSDGTPRRQATHRQLGMPPCTFFGVTGLPCPSCGMTTSFSLFVRGDLGNSLRANAVGTLLAGFCLLLLPWLAVSVYRGQTLFVRSLEKAATIVLLAFLGLALLRWAVLVGWAVVTGTRFAG